MTNKLVRKLSVSNQYSMGHLFSSEIKLGPQWVKYLAWFGSTSIWFKNTDNQMFHEIVKES